MLPRAVPRSFPAVKPPPLAEQCGASYPQLVKLMQRLLAPDGCAWDRQQSYASLRRYLLEEACEATDAIDRGDLAELCDELGDVLLQVVFLGELARRDGAFGPDDVVAGIVDKLVRRHPHVFGDGEAQSPAEVKASWERIKAAERAAKGDRRGLLDRVPNSLPPLARAQRLGARAAEVGFDWPSLAGARAKLDEELAELDAAVGAADAGDIEAELGDVLFALCNVARRLGVDAATALRASSRKFENRFRHVEQRVLERCGGWRGAPSLASMDDFWREAKAAERGAANGVVAAPTVAAEPANDD